MIPSGNDPESGHGFEGRAAQQGQQVSWRIGWKFSGYIPEPKPRRIPFPRQGKDWHGALPRGRTDAPGQREDRAPNRARRRMEALKEVWTFRILFEPAGC
ncbi:MAG: hypothetical protein CMF06_10170 [Hyphomonas sp.]|nr:hypothetical protein [Hyphomonas sp.]MAU67333.1 hypothetical protein [Hyphomonas sp.]MBM57029.1 hypothetical protein [Hyphomonas sp.]